MVPDDDGPRDEQSDEREWGEQSQQRDREQGGGRHEQRNDRGGRQRRQPRRNVGSSLLEGSSTTVNALIGGLAGIVLSFVPLSTVLGGIVAGYLEAGPGGKGVHASTNAGLTVGGIAGAIMLLPFLLFAYVGFSIVALSGSASLGGLFLVVFVLVALYTVGAGMLGGVLGIIVRDEVENRPDSRRGW